MPSTLGGLKVHLHRMTRERAMEVWPALGRATMVSNLDPVNVSEAILSGHVQVFLCIDPRVWFFGSFLRDQILPDWRVMHVIGGYTEGVLDKIFCSELVENLKKCAIGSNCNALLFNDKCNFLRAFLSHADEECWWIRIEEDSDG